MTVILIGGDLCPIGRTEKLFCDGMADSLFRDLLPEFRRADLSVVNLECPLIHRRSPIVKDGPALGAAVECINGLKSAGIDAVNLANNHILDHGEDGLKSTMAAIQGVGIDCFGAGRNVEEASEILIRDADGCRIGILGVAEHEFSIAGDRSWGANPLDVLRNTQAIRQSRSEWDFLVVLIHGGREGFRYPSPRLQQICRFFAEEGAGAVIVQHTHIAGCYEYFEGVPIVYGQGNFIFDAFRQTEPSWHEGFLVKLTVSENWKCTADWIPFSQSLDHSGVERMQAKQEQEFLRALESRSKEIEIDGAVQEKWLEYCRDEKYEYASRIRGHNRFLRVLNRKLHFSDWLYSRTTKLIQRNVVECEIHREALETLWRDSDTDF